MKKILASVACFVFTCALHAQLQQGSVASSNSPGGRTYFYQYKPPHYNDNTDLLPLIISLHGVGQAGNSNGSELANVLLDGLPNQVSTGLQLEFTYQNTTQGFVMLAPQTDRGPVNDWPTYYVDEMIAYGIANLRVDPSRVFLVGFSAGGGGVWKYASSSATAAAKLAGIAPAASSDLGSNYCNIASQKVAVWTFHGGADIVIPTQTDRNKANAINGCNPVIPAVDTIYGNESHGIYTSVVYNSSNNSHYPNVFQWMMKVNRNLDPNTNQAPVPVIAGPSVINYTAPVRIRQLPVLDGSGSADPDDIIMDYLWEQTTGTGPTVLLPVNSSTEKTRQFPVFQIPLPATGIGVGVGTYNFRLRVKDYLTSRNIGGINHTQFKTVTINVTMPASGHAGPAVDAGDDVILGANQTFVQRSGAAEFLYGGSVNSYKWRFISGPAAGGVEAFNGGTYPVGGDNNVRFVNMSTPGVYKFEFAVGSNLGDFGYDTVAITRLGALPVSYSYFTAQNTGGSNVLNWATTAELNSDRFDILRSADGVSFTKIGSELSRGGSLLTTYTFTDNNSAPGVTYYRLSQVDKDGHSSLSQIVSVNNRASGIYVERYPNPTHDNLTVSVQGNTNGNMLIAIADMQGKTILQQQWQKDQSLIKKSINVSALKNGVYQMIITIGNEKKISSFVKY